MNFTLYPIHELARDHLHESFDLQTLPFDIAEGVHIEYVQDRFQRDSFEHWQELLGRDAVQELRGVRYALVLSHPATARKDSEALVRLVAACLRLIRPMRKHVGLIWGTTQDHAFEFTGGEAPDFIEVPESQKLFSLRNRDAADLRANVPEFLRAMRGDFWKFRMALEFHERGYFLAADWKARYILWCSAIEAIYTSHDRQHRGSIVAKARIKWFLGEDTTVYPPGELSEFEPDPQLTIGRVVGDLYEMRNYIAHGDKISEEFFIEGRQGMNGPVRKAEVLMEVASFIIRSTLIKILHDRQLAHFANADAANAYFGAQKLTLSALRQ